MRFINTTTLQFEQVPDSELHLEENQYAILSHRWGRDEDEVTYQDILSSTDVSSKAAFTKIEGFCKIAAAENCRYGWVDTCCINKGDSSELAEAINSMYLWYKSSKICVVYLVDVPQKSIMDSEWFDRGWTLQELIAPKVVSFFDQDWIAVGTKTELLASLSVKTKIPTGVLSHEYKPSACSVAQRMSWAAKRITKRVEDKAYSLMGLFDVNMPMIYGEREKAFLRLQQHIIQKYKDESIFAWAMEHSNDSMATYSGLYAPSPSVFVNCDKIVPTPGSLGFSEIQGELSLSVEVVPHSPGTYCIILHCTDRAYKDNRVGITVARISDADEDVYSRVLRTEEPSQVLFQISKGGAQKKIRVPVDPSKPPMPIYYGFWLRTLEPPGHTESQTTILSCCPTSARDYIRQDYHNRHLNTGVVRIKSSAGSGSFSWSQIRWIKFGFSSQDKPLVWLANDSQSSRLDEVFEHALALVSLNAIPQSEELRDVMKEDPLDTSLGEPIRGLCFPYEWPEGKLLIAVDDSGVSDFVIGELNLKISIQLQPLHTLSMAFSEAVDHLGPPAEPMMAWVVDITEMEGGVRALSGRKIRSFGPREISRGDYCQFCIVRVLICPIACYVNGSFSEKAKDLFYLPEKVARREMDRAEMKEREDILRDAQTRLPLIDIRAGRYQSID